MKPNARLVFAVVLFCFFVSGMAGLVYQSVWARYLALFLGHTSYAVVAVLVAFMGGLALGNAWFGVKADSSPKPLALYGWLEIGIGVYALAFPTYYTFCHEAFVGLARHGQPGSSGLLALKFVFSFLTILCPTVLMGATFPVLTRFITRALSELRERVAALYCINSAGAVAGCLVADFWWVPTMGLEMTVFGGAILNLAAGWMALYLSRRLEEGAPALAENPPPGSSSDEQFTGGELRLAILGIGLSGFVAMLYEVAWTRLLALALGSSTHAFSLMLVTFITGIAVGAWIIYLWKNLRKTLEAFAWAELALAGTLFVSMFFYEYLPYWFVKLAGLLARKPEAYPVYKLFQALICCGVMFVPTVCLGMTLPLVSRIATAELARTGRSVGKVFAVNTIGTVVGTVVTGLWLMPTLGLARTFAVGFSLNALIGLAILGRNRIRRRWLILAPVFPVGMVWLTGLIFNPVWNSAFSFGLWRNPDPPTSVAAYRKMVAAEDLRFHRDGAGSTVTVVVQKVGGKEQMGLKVNGKADAGTQTDVPTQRLVGHIPMLLRPESQRILVVGLGSGMTCSAVARHPTIQRVDVVEISPEVVPAARIFAAYNDGVLDNPRLRVRIEDAKSFLKITDERYDVIISEPSNPWMAGVAGVFSLEYYQSCRDRLQADGLMAQWVQLYETSDQTLNMVISTFAAVFPYTSIWHPAPGDLILIGSTQPRKVDLEALEKRFAHPSVKEDLERTEIARLPVLLARELVSQQNGSFLPPTETALHSDFYPALEYVAQQAFFVRQATQQWRQYDENFSTRPTTLLGRYLERHPLTEADFMAFGRFFMEYGLPEADLFRSLVLRWQREQPESTLPMELMTQTSDLVLTAEVEALRLAPMAEVLFAKAEKDPEPLRKYESHLMQMYRSQRSIFFLPPSDRLQRVLERLIQTNPSNRRVYMLHQAELAWDRGEDAVCFQLAESALDPDVARGGPVTFSIDPKAPRVVLARMAETLWRSGKLQEARRLCQDAQANRYTGRHPVLDLTCRKIEAYATSADR
ncbi:MAG: fused MFS/spermidine synthase [Verrucomicrobiota bacterium]